MPFSQNANIGCNICAANSTLVDWSATSAIYGSVFAGNFKASHDTDTVIHYDLGILSAGNECTPTGSGSDAGPTPGMCGSCRDCTNQACVNGMCGTCTSNGQCYAPLTCQGGRCVSIM